MSTKLIEIALKNSEGLSGFDPFSLPKKNLNNLSVDINDLPIEAQKTTWSQINDYDRSFLSKTFSFKAEKHMLYFVNELIRKSNSLDHHPKIIIEADTIKVELYTHNINDISDLDLQLAKYTDEIYEDIVYLNLV